MEEKKKYKKATRSPANFSFSEAKNQHLLPTENEADRQLDIVIIYRKGEGIFRNTRAFTVAFLAVFLQ